MFSTLKKWLKITTLVLFVYWLTFEHNPRDWAWQCWTGFLWPELDTRWKRTRWQMCHWYEVKCQAAREGHQHFVGRMCSDCSWAEKMVLGTHSNANWKIIGIFTRIIQVINRHLNWSCKLYLNSLGDLMPRIVASCGPIHLAFLDICNILINFPLK